MCGCNPVLIETSLLLYTQVLPTLLIREFVTPNRVCYSGPEHHKTPAGFEWFTVQFLSPCWPLPSPSLGRGCHSCGQLRPLLINVQQEVGWEGMTPLVTGVTSPGWVPSQFLVPPQPLTGRAEWEVGKSLTECKHCSATTKTSEWSQHHFFPKSKT